MAVASGLNVREKRVIHVNRYFSTIGQRHIAGFQMS